MAWYGHVELARHLLSVGAYVNPKDNTGEVPLHFAAGNSQSEMCQLLILYQFAVTTLAETYPA